MKDGKHALLMNSALGLQPETDDDGKLMLAAVQGVEGLSMPYSFDLTLYRKPELGDIDPRSMINTRAAFAIRADNQTYIWRSGVIETFSLTGDNNIPHGGAKTMLSFQAHVVPAIKMLDHERVFRVFEGRSLVQIIHEVLNGFPNIAFGPYLDTTGLDPDDLSTTIDYAVQFNETSFAFLTRMLNQCGVGYHFDHSNASKTTGHSETLVLHGKTPSFTAVSIPEMIVDTGAAEARTISGFRTTFQPAHKDVYTGDFNTLKPSAPWRGHATVDADHNVLSKDQSSPSRFSTEGFPTTPPQVSKGGDQDNVNGDAVSAIQDEESGVASVAGQSKNRTFMAGQTFHIEQDKTKRNNLKPSVDFGEPSNKRYVLTMVAISAFDRDYGNNVGNDFLTFINPARWWARFSDGKDKPGIDVTAATASGTLQNWFQDEGKGLLDKVHSSPINILYSMGSTGLGLTANLLGIIGDSIKELISNHADDYSNIFSAIPWDAPRLARLPLPPATPAVANGPHLAVVIGENGIDTAAGDVYSDALGRVRVRFPWHRTLGASDNTSSETDPYKTGRNTAWVRVSEGWASQGFGTQFLPRIGDEVVVSFIDGDPSRPLITGRVYNANRGTSNLTFPPKGTKPPTIADSYVHDPKSPAPNANTLRSGIKTRSTPVPRPIARTTSICSASTTNSALNNSSSARRPGSTSPRWAPNTRRSAAIITSPSAASTCRIRWLAATSSRRTSAITGFTSAMAPAPSMAATDGRKWRRITSWRSCRRTG